MLVSPDLFSISILPDRCFGQPTVGWGTLFFSILATGIIASVILFNIVLKSFLVLSCHMTHDEDSIVLKTAALLAKVWHIHKILSLYISTAFWRSISLSTKPQSALFSRQGLQPTENSQVGKLLTSITAELRRCFINWLWPILTHLVVMILRIGICDLLVGFRRGCSPSLVCCE